VGEGEVEGADVARVDEEWGGQRVDGCWRGLDGRTRRMKEGTRLWRDACIGV
jgi:hypothetical protein